MANMITNNKEQVRDKTVLLFSGGMDSLRINHIKQPEVLLNISMNSNYDRTERATFDSIGIDESKLINMDGVIDLGRFERDDAIIPNRNAHLILLASHYGETILLGSVSGDRSYDKDERFYFHMENLLDHMWQGQHWTEERKFEIYSPFKNRTKTDLVEEYLQKDGKEVYLLTSYSCYEGEEQHCGQCKACFRKWVSLENNGIDTQGYWKKNPWDASWIDSVLTAIYNGGYRGKEDADIIMALDKSPVYFELDKYKL